MKPQYDDSLSNFAFKFNLRRYTVVVTSGMDVGPASYTGTASRDRLYKVPVVGVVSKPHAAWYGGAG